MDIKIECKLLFPEGKVPTKAHDTDAGYDVYAGWYTNINPKSMRRVQTGIAVSVPKGYYIAVRGRSGLSMKGLDVFGGTIDATYTGELMVTVINNSCETYTIKPGDRIAQIIVHKCEPTTIEVVEEFGPEYQGRGTKGWGSSGR